MKSRLLRCLVVDDEPLASALIASYVDRTPFLRLVAEVNTAADALAVLAEQPVDLLFLDIRMPGMSGLDLARMIPKGTRLVFITAYADHALEGFGVRALHYLLKPVSYAQFLEAANRALPENEPAAPAQGPSIAEFITVKSEYRLVRIPLCDILYVEGLKDYVKIYVEGRTQPVLTLMSMKTVEETLDTGRFLRVHRSFIVNMDKVRLVERNCIIMGDAVIPVSDSYRPAFNSMLGI